MTLIVIDAGHGSSTPGKRTPDGYREHWINVACAYFAEKALKRCGFTTKKCAWDDRDAKNDTDITITKRQELVRNAGADAVISFHANASNSNNQWDNATGCSIYIHGTDYKRKDSRKMAENINKYLCHGTEQRNRGIHERTDLGMVNAYYMKVKHAVLVEIGFMTNKEEAELMKTDAFCKEQAEDCVKGICDTFGKKYIPEVVPTPVKMPVFKVGTVYELTTEMTVRTGHGTDFAKKTHSELTSGGQKCDADKDGALDVGTRITCQEVYDGSKAIWVRCPSGWICAYNKETARQYMR